MLKSEFRKLVTFKRNPNTSNLWCLWLCHYGKDFSLGETKEKAFEKMYLFICKNNDNVTEEKMEWVKKIEDEIKQNNKDKK